MTLTSRTLALAASLLLASPLLLAQQPGGPPSTPPPAQGAPHGKGPMHHPSTHSRDQREERHDEMQDLDGLGLPIGDFWQNPRMVQDLGLTPDQVRRLSEANLQGRLKVIQLDANLEMEQAKLDALLDNPNLDNGAALSLTDRIADSRASIEKADAHLAFDLRAALTPDQLAKLRDHRMHSMPGNGRPGRSAAMKPASPPPPAQ